MLVTSDTLPSFCAVIVFRSVSFFVEENKMTMQTLRAAQGLSRERGELITCSNRNRVIESKKFKSKHMNAWKKEARLYA